HQRSLDMYVTAASTPPTATGRTPDVPPPATGFETHHPPHWVRPIRLRDQFLAQACQPLLQARRFDCREAHSIHTRCSRIESGQRIGVPQNVLAVNLVVEQVEAEGRLRLRLTIQLSLKGPDLVGVCRLIANPLHLAFFESTPEVRVLPSAGITRLQRSYDPVRLPPEPSPLRDVEAATLAHDGSPPITRIIFPTCRAHYPGGSSGCSCRLLPRSHGLPQMAGGSASALSLSRPAQASHALRPAGSLSRPKATFVTRLQPVQLPARAARQLPDQSTTLRMESSSTDDARLRGALP